MITYKIDVLQTLKERGYSSYRLRKEKIFSEKTIQGFRTGELPSWATIDKLCELTGLALGDLLAWAPG